MRINQFTTILLLLCCSLETFSQILENTTFYAVSSIENTTQNALHQFDLKNNKLLLIGSTGVKNINAITIDNASKKLYAVSEGILGTLNTNSGVFTAIGQINDGNGSLGLQSLNNIYGLTYNQFTNTLFATHNRPGNDLLFQINPANGKVVENAMTDRNGNPSDYVPVDKVFANHPPEEMHNVKDIAYNPYLNCLTAIHSTNNNDARIFTKINASDGSLESIIYELSGALSGITYSSSGELFGTTIENNSLSFIDILDASAKTIAPLRASETYPKFEDIANSGLVNDLALQIKPGANQAVYQGRTVSFDITLHNQGEIINDNVTITNYIPDGLVLTDNSDWTVIGNKAVKTINQTILPASSFSTSINFEVMPNFLGTIVNEAEISGSFNNSIVSANGDPIPLPDIDSTPNDKNEEIGVIDDFIDGKGSNFNEDEDDHDIAAITIQNSTNATNCQCYSVAKNTGTSDNSLHVYNSNTNSWSLVGKTNTSNIDALAIDTSNDILYAIEDGILGKIDRTTGLFNPFGSLNYGNGANGNILLNNIVGHSYDRIEHVLFAAHRVEGDTSGTEDILFKMDLATGEIIKDGMKTPSGQTVDYAIIPALYDREYDTEILDVSGIAFNVYSNELYVVYNQFGNSLVANINKNDGLIESVILDINASMGEITLNGLGEFFALESSIPNEHLYDMFVSIDFVNNATTNTISIDSSGAAQNFQSLTCAGPFNDLALKMTLSSTQTQPVLANDEVTFDITIYNQGELANENITITNYIPDGLSLSTNSDWTIIDTTAVIVLDQTLLPGSSFNTSISFTVNAGYAGTIINQARITSSFSNSVFDKLGNPVSLQDIDSKNSPYFDEDLTVVVDDFLNGKGSHANEDEDSHDISQITVDCFEILDTDEIYAINVPGGIHKANKEIWSNGVVSGNQEVVFQAGDTITLKQNFEVLVGSKFNAKIGTCD